MWTSFLLTNIHFAIDLVAAGVFACVAWLYFDASIVKKKPKETFKTVGFSLLAISFLFDAALLEGLDISVLGNITGITRSIYQVIRLFAYLFIIWGLVIDPLQPRPKTTGLSENNLNSLILPLTIPFFGGVISFLLAPLSVIAGFLYLRRATVGLENHLKPMAMSLFAISIVELLSISNLFMQTNNITLYNIIAPFGPIWILKHLLVIASILIIRRWVFGYLLTRLQSQLFIAFAAAIITIFLFTTVTFTGLLLRNIEDETIKQLVTSVKVLNFALDNKKQEILADGQVLASNLQIVKAVEQNDAKTIQDDLQSFLIAKKLSTLVIINNGAEIIARGEDASRVGESLSEDSLVKRSLLGENTSSITRVDGPLAPIITVKAGIPIYKDETVIGVVIAGSLIDNAFVDGIKSTTGLQASIYGEDILSATTLFASPNNTRAVGIKENNQNIKTQVMQKALPFSGSSTLLNVPYFVAVLPLLDIDNSVIGMISVGKPQIGVYIVASRSIELTFIISILLLLLSTIPAYLISRYLAKQIR